MGLIELMETVGPFGGGMRSILSATQVRLLLVVVARSEMQLMI